MFRTKTRRYHIWFIWLICMVIASVIFWTDPFPSNRYTWNVPKGLRGEDNVFGITISKAFSPSAWVSNVAQKSDCWNETDMATLHQESCDILGFLKALNKRILLAHLAYPESKHSTSLPMHKLTGCHLVFHNRIPKAGSRSIHDVMEVLGSQRNYTVTKRAGGMGKRPRDGRTLNASLSNFITKLDNIRNPTVFLKHIYFVDLVRMPYKPLVMINVIRDPLEHTVSVYSWKKYRDLHSKRPVHEDKLTLDDCIATNGASSDCFHWRMTATPFLCGHQDGCWEALEEPSFEQVQRAKYHIANTFLVVGLLEYLSEFMEVLETLLPQFFCGLVDLYKEMDEPIQALYGTSVKENITSSTRAFILQHLKHSYDLYYFTKKRFFDILKALRQHKQLTNGVKDS